MHMATHWVTVSLIVVGRPSLCLYDTLYTTTVTGNDLEAHSTTNMNIYYGSFMLHTWLHKNLKLPKYKLCVSLYSWTSSTTQQKK